MIFFSSNRPGGRGARDLFRAERPDRGSFFGGIAPMIAVGFVQDDVAPWVSLDRREIVFAARPSGVWSLFQASR